MAALTPVPKIQFFDANGHPLAGGKLYSYSAGTTTPLVTYTDQAGTSANTNPVILDARGEASVWLGTGSYKLRLTTATDVDIWTVDDIYSEGALSMQELLSSAGSSLVGFIQSGTGATYRTVQSKLRDTVSVKDFGAVGDGVADDTAAFAAAIAASTGEIILDPTQTYAVNLVITKRGTRINGRSGDNLSVAGAPIKNLIPHDPTKPVIQIGNDNSYVGGVTIENLSIWSRSPSGTHGQIGLYLAGGAYGNTVRNVQIGSSFSVHNLKLSGGATYANAYNQIIGLQLWTLANVSQTATLGLYYGATYCVANYISNFNITGPGGTGTGYAIQIDSVTAYMSDGWVQASDNKGVNFTKTWTTFPKLLGSNIAVDSDDSADVLITSSVASLTEVLPINFLSGSITVDGYFKNAAAVSNPLTQYREYIPDSALQAYPISFGGYSVFNQTTSNKVTNVFSVSGANDNIFFGGNTAGYTMVSGGVNGVYLAVAGATAFQAVTSSFRPQIDGSPNLGTASQRWNTVYATTGTINTSDEREKQQIRALTAAEQRVAVALKSLVKAFKFNSAVQAKGDDNARIHVGVIAQEVIAAFQAENLDPMRYGIVCYDQWDAEGDRPAGDRYGVRYEELLAFIIAAL